MLIVTLIHSSAQVVCSSAQVICLSAQVFRSSDSRKCSDYSLKCSYDSLTCLGVSLKCSGDSLKCLGDPLKCSGDSLKCSGDSLVWVIHSSTPMIYSSARVIHSSAQVIHSSAWVIHLSTDWQPSTLCWSEQPLSSVRLTTAGVSSQCLLNHSPLALAERPADKVEAKVDVEVDTPVQYLPPLASLLLRATVGMPRLLIPPSHMVSPRLSGLPSLLLSAVIHLKSCPLVYVWNSGFCSCWHICRREVCDQIYPGNFCSIFVCNLATVLEWSNFRQSYKRRYFLFLLFFCSLFFPCHHGHHKNGIAKHLFFISDWWWTFVCIKVMLS